MISHNTGAFVSLFALTFCVSYTEHSECAEASTASGYAGGLTAALTVLPVDDSGLTQVVMMSPMDGGGLT